MQTISFIEELFDTGVLPKCSNVKTTLVIIVMKKMHLTFERSDYITSTCSELACVFNRISVLPMLVHFKSRIFLSSSCVLRHLIFGK